MSAIMRAADLTLTSRSINMEFLGLMKKASKSSLALDVLNIPNVQVCTDIADG